MEQRAPGTMLIWANPFTNLRVPKIFNLRTDPYERADITSNTYYDWLLDHAFLLVPAQDYVGKFLMTFKDYPQRQKAASFNMDEVLAKLKEVRIWESRTKPFRQCANPLRPVVFCGRPQQRPRSA